MSSITKERIESMPIRTCHALIRFGFALSGGGGFEHRFLAAGGPFGTVAELEAFLDAWEESQAIGNVEGAYAGN